MLLEILATTDSDQNQAFGLHADVELLVRVSSAPCDGSLRSSPSTRSCVENVASRASPQPYGVHDTSA